MTAGTVCLGQNKTFKLYALVSQYLFLILILTVGGFLLGRYVIIKSVFSGGIIATIGAISGIVLFILELIKIGVKNEKR